MLEAATKLLQIPKKGVETAAVDYISYMIPGCKSFWKRLSGKQPKKNWINQQDSESEETQAIK